MSGTYRCPCCGKLLEYVIEGIEVEIEMLVCYNSDCEIYGKTSLIDVICEYDKLLRKYDNKINYKNKKR